MPRDHPSSEREIKFRRCLFTSSTKREIRHLHDVVMQKRAKKCTNKRDARAKLLFLIIAYYFFSRSCWSLRR